MTVGALSKIKQDLESHLKIKITNHSWLSKVLQGAKGTDLSQFFPYCVQIGGSASLKAQKSILPLNETQKYPLGKKGKPLFLANIPMGVAPFSEKIEEKVKKLLSIVANESFSSNSTNSKSQAENKLAPIIGINQIESIDKEANRRFIRNIRHLDTSQFTVPHRVQGFFWVPEWRQKIPSIGIYPKEKAYLLVKCIDPSRGDLLRGQLEGKGTLHDHLRSQIPYQKIREHIKNSASNLDLVDSISSKAVCNSVYFVTMDDDIKGLRPAGRGYFSLLEDNISEIRKKKNYFPSVISLGYQLSKNALPIPKLAVKCDMAVRAALNKIIPGAVYMPEPGTAYCFVKSNLKKNLKTTSFCGKKGDERALESRRFIQSGVENGLFEKEQMEFISSSSLETTMPNRMATKIANKYPKLCSDDLRKREVLKSLRGISQVHFSPLDWGHAVFEGLPDELKGGQRGISQKLSGIFSQIFKVFDFIHLATQLVDPHTAFKTYEEFARTLYLGHKDNQVKFSRGRPVVMLLSEKLEPCESALQSQFALLLAAKKQLIDLNIPDKWIEKIVDAAAASSIAFFKELKDHPC